MLAPSVVETENMGKIMHLLTKLTKMVLIIAVNKYASVHTVQKKKIFRDFKGLSKSD